MLSCSWCYGSVFFHTFMPVQLFALRHPEFDFIWNWEMDVRYTGHYGRFLTSVSHWAKKQSREGLWERNARFYIPSYHGSYENFARNVPRAINTSNVGVDRLNGVPQGTASIGIDEGADLITLFPMFEIAGSLWHWKDYLIHYNATEAAKLRRGTVGTNVRLSRKLLMAMHNENKEGRSMMSEMWPPTVALHNHMKAVYAPHSMFLERRWPADMLQSVFNAGPDGQVGGSLDTVVTQGHNFEGSTWFWETQFPLDLYTRWLGRSAEGPGSPLWEQDHGQLCLPAMLLHPVKTERLTKAEKNYD